jgi:hypothetical protein
MPDKLGYLVYVQLGTYYPKTLGLFAKHAEVYFPYLERILVTDNVLKTEWPSGKVIVTAKKSESSNDLLKQHPYYKELAKSYWLNTFERLFALRCLAESALIENLPIIHLESDVLPFITSETISFLNSNFTTLSVPRHDEMRGIGSIVFSPNLQELENGLNNLEYLMKRNSKVINNDMDLLGFGLNEGVIQELPSHPGQYDSGEFKFPDGKRFLFDGAAFGQYLFGQDPFHQENYRISGYRNPGYCAKTKIEDFTFAITNQDGQPNLIGEFCKQKYVIANLHIHSKELLPELSSTNTRWKRAIDEANGTSARLSEFVEEISPHAQIPALLIRIQIARKNGIFKALISFLLRKLKK